MTGDNITQIALAILTILSALATGLLIPWIRSRTGREKIENTLRWAEILVHFAEELYKATPKAGEVKHGIVKDYLLNNFKLTEEQADIIIKALVNKMNQAKEKALE